MRALIVGLSLFAATCAWAQVIEPPTDAEMEAAHKLCQDNFQTGGCPGKTIACYKDVDLAKMCPAMEATYATSKAAKDAKAASDKARIKAVFDKMGAPK